MKSFGSHTLLDCHRSKNYNSRDATLSLPRPALFPALTLSLMGYVVLETEKLGGVEL